MNYPLSPVTRKRRLQKYALAHDIAIPKGFAAVVPRVGKPARLLVRRVQEHARLRVTGYFNDATLDLLFPERLGLKVAAAAIGEVGVCEVPRGSNTGSRVRMYQKAAGVSSGPWCAAFATWALKQVVYRGRRISGRFLPPNPAYVPSWELSAKGITSWCSHPNPHLVWLSRAGWRKVRRGDFVVYETGDGGTGDHIGIFLGWVIPASIFVAVEGNSHDRVERRMRKLRETTGFIRVRP